MADNYTISNVEFRSDDIGDVQHPVVKIMHGVDGAAAFASSTDPLPTTGTVAIAEAKAEDSAHASGDRGVPILAVRTDTPAARAGSDGDYSNLITDNTGRLVVRADYVAASDNTTDSISAAIDSSYLMDDHTRIAPKFTQTNISAGTGTIVSAVASKSIRVIAMTVTVSNNAGTFNIREGASGTSLIGTRSGISGFHMGYNPVGHFQTGTNAAITGSVSTGVMAVCATYIEV